MKSVADELLERDEMLGRLLFHLESAQQRMVREVNKHRRHISFDVGDKVFLKFRPYRQLSLFWRLNVKLAPHYFGHFVVTHKVGTFAYRPLLPEGTRLHPVFHVSQLKPIVGDHLVEGTLPPDCFDLSIFFFFFFGPHLMYWFIWSGDTRFLSSWLLGLIARSMRQLGLMKCTCRRSLHTSALRIS